MNKTYTVTMTIVDDDLGLENYNLTPVRVLQILAYNKEISLDDFEIVSVEEA